MSDWIDQEFIDGYCDGRDKVSPPPSGNRTTAYRHSWEIGRLEIEGRYNEIPPAQVSRAKAEKIAHDLRTPIA